MSDAHPDDRQHGQSVIRAQFSALVRQQTEIRADAIFRKDLALPEGLDVLGPIDGQRKIETFHSGQIQEFIEVLVQMTAILGLYSAHGYSL